MYQINTNILNSHHIICELYLSKAAGREKAIYQAFWEWGCVTEYHLFTFNRERWKGVLFLPFKTEWMWQDSLWPSAACQSPGSLWVWLLHAFVAHAVPSAYNTFPLVLVLSTPGHPLMLSSDDFSPRKHLWTWRWPDEPSLHVLGALDFKSVVGWCWLLYISHKTVWFLNKCWYLLIHTGSVTFALKWLLIP